MAQATTDNGRISGVVAEETAGEGRGPAHLLPPYAWLLATPGKAKATTKLASGITLGYKHLPPSLSDDGIIAEHLLRTYGQEQEVAASVEKQAGRVTTTKPARKISGEHAAQRICDELNTAR